MNEADILCFSWLHWTKRENTRSRRNLNALIACRGEHATRARLPLTKEQLCARLSQMDCSFDVCLLACRARQPALHAEPARRLWRLAPLLLGRARAISATRKRLDQLSLLLIALLFSLAPRRQWT